MTTGATITSLDTLDPLTVATEVCTIAGQAMGAIGPTTITTERMDMVVHYNIMMTMTVGISGLVREAGRHSVKFAGPGSIRAMSQIP